MQFYTDNKRRTSIEQSLRKHIFAGSMASDLKNRISLTEKIIDEAYNPQQCLNYSLNIQISLDDICITVNDRNKNKFIAFEKFQFQHSFNFDLMDVLLEDVFRSSGLINHKYAGSNCILVNNLSTIIPDALFDEDRKKMYLKFNTPLEGDELIFANDLKNLNAKNLFAIPFAVKSKIDYALHNVNYIHYSTILINELLTQNKNQHSKKIYAHIQQSHFELIVIESNELLFYNTFNYQSAEDLLYYLLFAFEQLQINPEKDELSLIGEVDKNSNTYTTLHKFVRTIKFAERKDGADFCYQLQSLPKHFYFNLFNA